MTVDPACPLNWSHPLNDGLVFDYTILPNCGWSGGGTLRNIVRGGRKATDGTLLSGAARPTWRRGQFGRCLLFNGAANQGVTIASSPELNLQPPFTLCAWGYYTGGNPNFPFAKWDPSTNKRQYHIKLDTLARFLISTTGVNSAALNSGAVSANAWHFICAGYDGANGYMSVDGAAFSSALMAISGNLYSDNTQPATIGLVPNLSVADGFNFGQMGYNRLLSSAEVAALYKETKAGNPNRLRWLTAPVSALPNSASSSPPVVSTDDDSWALGLPLSRPVGVRSYDSSRYRTRGR